MDRHALYDKIGLAREFVTRGENALFFSDAARFTDAQRTLLQAQLDRFYDRFVNLVADGREMDAAAVHAVAEGRVWTGAQALDRGLVDGLGGLHRALDSVRSLLDLEPGARLALRTDERHPGFLERLIRRTMNGAVDAGTPVAAPWFSPLVTDVAVQAQLLDGRPLALLPLRIEFR
jgi:protease-4